MVPVLVGGDIGAYALARAFHEHAGIRSVVLARVVTRFFAATKLADVRVVDVEDQDIMVAALVALARERAGERLVLLTNADWYAAAINAARPTLEPLYDIVLCSPAAFARVESKEAFQHDCESLGIPVPLTVAVTPSQPLPDDVVARLDTLTYPVVGKASSSADFHFVEFPGKAKVHHLHDRTQVTALIDQLRVAGYAGTFLFQEFIPGDETHMRSLTAYRDRSGTVTLLATGRVLLEEHTAGTLGVPAAILTEQYPDAMDAMERYLAHIDYHGFANADFKLDPRTGTHVFFEVNPRIGRNNYYVTAAGASPAAHVIADLNGVTIEPVRVTAEVLYSVVPIRLLLRYLPDADLRRRVKRAARRVLARPLMSPQDRSARRAIAVWGFTLNFWRKYRTHYPRYREDGI